MKLLLVSEAATILNASSSHVYGLMRSGRLPYISIGTGKQGGKRIRQEDLQLFIDASRTVEQTPASSRLRKTFLLQRRPLLKHLRVQ